MKHKLLLTTTSALVALSASASAQGLLSIGHNMDIDFDRRIPFVVTAGATLGWDSNANLGSGSPGNEEEDSLYMSANIGVAYNTGDKRSSLRYYANYTPLYYFDAPVGVDSFQHNLRLGLDYRHRVNERLTISDSFYVAYEIEPNYSIGGTVARRNDQYLYGHNSLAAAYSWNRRFSTVTSWTIGITDYEENVFDAQDSMTNTFANEFRYALSRTTTLAATYRYSITDYDGAGLDYDSHFFLAGVDHRFNPRLTGSFRAGVELRDRDLGGNETSPYFEGALTYYVTKRTSARWYGRYSMAQFDTGSGSDAISTGFSADHRFNSRLSGNTGVHYSSTSYDGLGGFDDDTISFNLGFNYSLAKNISLNGGYSFVTSNRSFGGDYDRHHLQLGIGAQF